MLFRSEIIAGKPDSGSANAETDTGNYFSGGYAAVDHSIEKISKTPGIGAWYIHAGGDDCHSDSIWIN